MNLFESLGIKVDDDLASFLRENQEYELAITFAILDQSILEVGQRILKEVIPE